MRKLDYITVLRGVAILAVLGVHASQLGTGMQYVHPFIIGIFNNGARGVQLFYLLSAFTLFLSFSCRGPDEKLPVSNYFIRRFFRIAPLYYLAIIYYSWQNGGSTAGGIVSNLLFVHGFNPYWINGVVPGGWSVADEFIFYAMLPLLFYCIKNIQQACTFTLATLVIRLVMLVLLSRFPLISDKDLWYNYLIGYLPNQLPIFGLGIVLYFIINGEQKKLSHKFLAIAAAIIVGGLALEPGLFIPDMLYFTLAFMGLAYALQHYHPTLLFNAGVKYIGKISYTLYLSHWAVLYILHKYPLINVINSRNEFTALGNFALNFGVLLGLSVALSSLLYYTIESPMQAVGKRLIAYREKQLG
ncbi:MAG: acyltransferase [Bacteroidota bacterium]